ncbi:MAG TPA: hypothetical protein VKB35_05675, partial [Ktedonobacteraceae bacterium]|nr:hypothetical protein [Ktedonobacteraceae bacterium]
NGPCWDSLPLARTTMLMLFRKPINDRNRSEMNMEFQESFSVMTDIWQLEQGGFSSDEIAGLLKVKALYQRGAYDETDSEQNRLAFVRWLYVQGRLES